MPDASRETGPARAVLESVVREEHGRVLATLIADLGDFDLAEDALQEAAGVALERWPVDGLPEQPAAWLTTVARRRALDRLRHRAVHRAKEQTIRRALQDRLAERAEEDAAVHDREPIPDERLRLVFTCCHPALSREAQVALTLRTLGGLGTDAVAAAFLVPEATMAKRLVRAQHKLRDAAIPYRVPDPEHWGERLSAVLAVVYLIFNQGWSATPSGPDERTALCAEAIRLGRVLAALVPEEPEVWGLLALMLLHDARRAARTDAAGEMVALEAQDPARFDPERLAEGRAALRLAERHGHRAGPYAIQAAISAAHVGASESGASETERWRAVAALYAALETVLPTVVVRLNRAVAVGRAEGAEAGLARLEALREDASLAARLEAYQPLHAARADLLRRAGRPEAARAAYDRAIELAEGERERRFLARRRDALD